MTLKISLELTEDKLHLYLILDAINGFEFETEQDIQDKISDLGVVKSVENVRLKKALNKLESFTQNNENNNEIPPKVLIAVGKNPILGKNGHVEFKVDISGEPKYSIEDDEKKIDYKNSMNFTELNKGQVIGIIHQPIPGTAGKNLLGEEIPVPPVFPYNLNIKDGVRLEGEKIISDCAGIPHFKKRDVYVRSCVVIDGDVGPETGNVIRSGCIHVKGDVLDGYTVQSNDDIFVAGGVFKANIQTERDLIIEGGIQLDDSHSIVAGGMLQTKFIQGGKFQIREGIKVSQNILHAFVETLESIETGGSIIGGEASALKSISIKHSSNPESTKTRLRVLSHFEFERYDRIYYKLKTHALELQSNPILSHVDKLLDPEEKKNALKLLKELNEISSQMEALERKLESLQKVIASVNFPNIEWKKGYHSGTVIEIGKMRSVLNLDNLTHLIAHIGKDSGLIELKAGKSI